MSEGAISFHAEDVPFPLDNEEQVAAWLREGVRSHRKELVNLSFIFVSDERLYEMNNEYLRHDYYTDVITFDYSDVDGIAGDVFISVERVRENAGLFKDSFQRELSRVIIHGVLHLLGFGDKTRKEKEKMREEEEKLLNLCPYLDGST